MNLSRPLPNARRALQMAQARRLFPTEATSAELRDMEREFLRRSVFSARVTNTRFLQAVKTRVERLLNADAPNVGQARRELRALLKSMNYKPEPGQEGTIQDLSTTARLDLILITQARLMSGHAQRQHGLTPSSRERAPAWEFLRVEESAAPRDWLTRWNAAGGRTTKEGGEEKFIALKTSPIWDALGDAALFDDALNVNHPPFAFHSGMAWAGVSARRCERLGIRDDDKPTPGAPVLPDNVLDVSDISRPLLRKLEAALRAVEAEEAAPGKLRIRSPRKAAKAPPRRASAEPEPDAPAAPPRAGSRTRALIDRYRDEFNAALAIVGGAEP